MPSVLEGLAKFAHLINIEFFDDLIKVLNELIGSGVSNTKDRNSNYQSEMLWTAGSSKSKQLTEVTSHT